MATAVLSRRVEKVVGYPPLSEMSDQQRREFHEAEGHAMLASLLFNATPDAVEPSRVIELLRDAVKEVAALYDEAAPTVADPSLEPIRAKADKADDALKRSVDAVSGPPPKRVITLTRGLVTTVTIRSACISEPRHLNHGPARRGRCSNRCCGVGTAEDRRRV